MNPIADLQKKILGEIPILASMGIEIASLDKNQSVVKVPLAPNHNHKGTAFGGSLYAACTAACYTLIYSRQMEAGISERDLVITEGQMKYRKPIKKDFFVRGELLEKNWQDLLLSLKNKRPERLKMTCFIFTTADEIACEFNAEFALLPSDRKS